MDNNNKFLNAKKKIDSLVSNNFNFDDENTYKKDTFSTNFIPDRLLKKENYSVAALRYML